MKILVGYATKHGSTGRMAEFIAEQLNAAGLVAEAVSVEAVEDARRYDAYVIGSAVYFGHWLKPAVAFVEQAAEVLSERPTWLFSSGPLGEASRAAHGDTQESDAEAEEIPRLIAAVQARDHAIFDGVLDPGTLGMRDRLIRTLPAGRALLPEGDFRDWERIAEWAKKIAYELTPAGARPLN
jgi:menaquinone-dependent protoporphyrinogen oxidase